jgi:sugar/nucleoside kinase (ribokinase family)
MPYDRLPRHLATSDSPTVTTLPDGSIDHYCSVSGGAEALETRASFARGILGDRSSFGFHVETTEPGGQAVNAAKQLHGLGGDVTCYGHLEGPVFEPLPFETVSMGDPSTVYVLEFADRDVMFVDDSALTDWTLEEIRRVGGLPDVLHSDAVCCSNWTSASGLEAAFHRLGTEEAGRVPFVFDPGDVVGNSPDRMEALHDALAALQNTFDVVYNGNREEVRATADPLGAFESDIERLAAIREATGITAAVMHARDEAAVAAGDGRTRVENYRALSPERHTGGGDRFSGALTHALACGWDWDVALACANACATYYVESGETGTAADVARLVEERPAAGP